MNLEHSRKQRASLTRKERRQARLELIGATPEAQRRRTVDARCEPPRAPLRERPWKQSWSALRLRSKYFDQVNDASQLPKPLPPRPPRRDKRGQSKPR